MDVSQTHQYIFVVTAVWYFRFLCYVVLYWKFPVQIDANHPAALFYLICNVISRQRPNLCSHRSQIQINQPRTISFPKLFSTDFKKLQMWTSRNPGKLRWAVKDLLWWGGGGGQKSVVLNKKVSRAEGTNVTLECMLKIN